MKSKKVKRHTKVLLLLACISAIIIIAIASLLFGSYIHIALSGRISVVKVVSIFNGAGYRFFGQHGYIIAANYTPTKFPTSGIKVFKGFQTTALVGTLSLSSNVYALIFNNSASPASEASNLSMAYEYFGYETQNPLLKSIGNYSIDGIIVHFYNITTSLPQSYNHTIYLHNFGSVFSFGNILVFGFFNNYTQAAGVNRYLVEQIV